MRYWDFEEDFDEAVQVGLQVIGAMVRGGRLQRGLTQRQLAWRSTLSQSAISRLETGRSRGMRLRTFAAIIGVLQTNKARARRGRGRVDDASWLEPDGLVQDPAEPPAAQRRLPGQKKLAADAMRSAQGEV
jgi:transcriptional regulator with XRE-family HTH domain